MESVLTDSGAGSPKGPATSSSPQELANLVRSGDYLAALLHPVATALVGRFAAYLVICGSPQADTRRGSEVSEAVQDTSTETPDVAVLYAVSTAALKAFLQANVTGPVLHQPYLDTIIAGFVAAVENAAASLEVSSVAGSQVRESRALLRRLCLSALEADGIVPYAHAPVVELFCLARWALMEAVGSDVAPETVLSLGGKVAGGGGGGGGGGGEERLTLGWTRLRLHAWHFRLLASSTPSLSPGSAFTRSVAARGGLGDVPSLEEALLASLRDVGETIVGSRSKSDTAAASSWTRDERVTFLLEEVNVRILMGQDVKAREALKRAAEESGFQYALSGALGKRTKWQHKSTSQLVVLARSVDETGETWHGAVPEALKLDSDTLLEAISFTGDDKGADSPVPDSALPEALRQLLAAPDKQPALLSRDQIILLAEATIRDAFSPADSLTSEEVLPFAVRVLDDNGAGDTKDSAGRGKGKVNWQVFTQGLLVRSRIEVHRNHTMERGVLQLQALVDQVLVDTLSPSTVRSATEHGGAAESTTNDANVPKIQLSPADGKTDVPLNKPTTFLRAPKPNDETETAPAHLRLRHVHALPLLPLRWQLESELGYAWVGAGSLASALDIFRRLRLWAEVALCLAAADNDGIDDGPQRSGALGEHKARAVLRWRLFQRSQGEKRDDREDTDVDLDSLRESDFHGPLHDPSTIENAPRLLCILADLELATGTSTGKEEAVKLYEQAWAISRNRFARAQRSLGELYARQGDLRAARDAYRLALGAAHTHTPAWTALGDVCLRLGKGFEEEAVEAYSRAIAVGGGEGDEVEGGRGESAKTWSNLGGALWALHLVRAEEESKDSSEKQAEVINGGNNEEGIPGIDITATPKRATAAALLAQSLAAFKRGAALAHDNWRIWDNVATLAARVRPVATTDMVTAMTNVLRIRHSEDVVDADLLAGLMREVGMWDPLSAAGNCSADGEDGFMPPRGTPGRAVADLLERHVAPLVTARSDLWALVGRARAARGDLSGAIDAAERGWRAAVGTGAPGTTLGASVAGGGGSSNWLQDKTAWDAVVARTDELVAALENWGPRVSAIGDTRWKSRARAAVRSVMGKAKEAWEGTEGWRVLEGLRDGLKG